MQRLSGAKAAASVTNVAGHTLDRSTIALLVTLGLGVFAGALDLGVLSPALPAIALAFGVAPRDASLLVGVYLLANVAAIPTTTKLADRYGRRRVYLACIGIFAAGSLISIVAQSFWELLAGRAVQAAGAGGIFPVAAATIADRVPKERRGASLGILGAIWGLAGILGPLVGGVLTAASSWRAVFVFNIPLSLVVVLLARRHVPAVAPAKRGPLDVPGIALLTLALVAAIAGLTRFDVHALTPAGLRVPAVALVVAIGALAGLHVVERRAAEPVLSPALLANRQIAVTYFVELLIGALEGALFFVPAALVAGEHLGETGAGAIAAIGAVLFVVVIPLAGRALDRFGARAVLGAGAVCTAAGLALFAAGYTVMATAILAMIIAGTGFGALLGAPTRYVVSNEAPEAVRTAAIGLLSIFLIIGQVVGSSLAGGLIGSGDVISGTYRVAYLGFAALALVTAAATRLLAAHRPAAS